MSNWITHCRIADALLLTGLDVDAEHFSVGNIAPDCNVENEDWSAFIPPREVTHWMYDEKNKLSADYEGFYAQHLANRPEISKEERSFLLGYYVHLITDVEAQRDMRDPERVKNIFARIAAKPELAIKVCGLPANMDTLKSVFGGRNAVSQDIRYLENDYLLSHPDSVYNTFVRRVTAFPDYLAYLPAGAVPRKVRVMAKSADPNMESPDFLFYSKEEYEALIQNTTECILTALRKKGIAV